MTLGDMTHQQQEQNIAPASFLYLYLACTHRSQRVRVAEAELVSA